MMTTKKKQLSLETICAQADHPQNDPYGSHTMPLYQTSTFSFKTAEDGRRFFAGEEGGASHSYSRLGNPTVEQLERVLAQLESYDSNVEAEAMSFGSGMAAISTALMAIGNGKRILAQEALYGCTSQFLHEEAAGLNIKVSHVDSTDLDAVQAAFELYDDIALVYLETIANPTLRVCDLEAITRIAKANGALVMTDNTFATPYHLRPLSLGVDIVAHSTTKYLCGHGTVIGGALIARKGIFEETHISTFRKNMGGVSGPFDAWLTLMGIKTLPLRMKKHVENAEIIAGYLRSHPNVEKVFFPGFEDHPDHEVASRLLENGFGGMIAFELKGGYEAGVEMMNNVKLCTLAVSLGTVDSLIQHPASMTHSVMTPEVRNASGITDGLIRLSAGVESVEDLIFDLEQAL